MTDAELSARMRDNIVAFKRLQGAHFPVPHLALPGVHAFALPSKPLDVYQQLVLYETPAALAGAQGALEAFYRAHAVPAWRVLVPAPDTEARALLGGAGYHAEEAVPVLGLALQEALLEPPTLALERPATLAGLLALNEALFEERIEHLQPWQARLPPAAHPLQVREGAGVLSGGLAVDAGDATGLYLMATAPAARRRGLASEVLRGLLLQARERGLAAAVLQSSPEGYGVYTRQGLREVDRWTSWVRGGT